MPLSCYQKCKGARRANQGNYLIYFPQKDVHNSLCCDVFFLFIIHQLHSTAILSHLCSFLSLFFNYYFFFFLSKRQYKCYAQGSDNKKRPPGNINEWNVHIQHTDLHIQYCRILTSNLKSTSSQITSLNELLIEEAQTIDRGNNQN